VTAAVVILSICLVISIGLHIREQVDRDNKSGVDISENYRPIKAHVQNLRGGPPQPERALSGAIILPEAPPHQNLPALPRPTVEIPRGFALTLVVENFISETGAMETKTRWGIRNA
jgi:hypothetical protein